MHDGKVDRNDIRKSLVDPKIHASVTWAAHVDDASGRHVIVQHHQRVLRVFVDGTVVCELRNPSTVKFME
jgi:hypothetical protein